MCTIGIEISKEEERLEKIWRELDEEWQNAARTARNLKEYDETSPLFDKALQAFNDWNNFRFNNGHKLLAQR